MNLWAKKPVSGEKRAPADQQSRMQPGKSIEARQNPGLDRIEFQD
jgi:hypothetical protein